MDKKETAVIKKEDLIALKEKAYMADLYLSLHRCKHCNSLVTDPYCCPNEDCPKPYDP